MPYSWVGMWCKITALILHDVVSVFFLSLLNRWHNVYSIAGAAYQKTREDCHLSVDALEGIRALWKKMSRVVSAPWYDVLFLQTGFCMCDMPDGLLMSVSDYCQLTRGHACNVFCLHSTPGGYFRGESLLQDGQSLHNDGCGRDDQFLGHLE